MNTGVHDFASDSRSLYHPGSFPHPKEGTGNAFMVGTMGFFGKEGADPLLVGDQRNPRSSVINGLDPAVAQQETRCTVLVHNQTVECRRGESHTCLGSET